MRARRTRRRAVPCSPNSHSLARFFIVVTLPRTRRPTRRRRRRRRSPLYLVDLDRAVNLEHEEEAGKEADRAGEEEEGDRHEEHVPAKKAVEGRIGGRREATARLAAVSGGYAERDAVGWARWTLWRGVHTDGVRLCQPGAKGRRLRPRAAAVVVENVALVRQIIEIRNKK